MYAQILGKRESAGVSVVRCEGRFACLGILCLATAWVGCSGSVYVPVSGTVRLDGQPLADAKLIFEPIGDAEGISPGKPSYGRTDAAGRYTLRSPLAEMDGAAQGKHRVRIVTATTPAYTEAQKKRAREVLEHQEKSGGNPNPEISEDMVKAYLSDAVLPDFKETLPAKYNSETELQVEIGPGGTADADFDLTSS